MDAAAPLCVVYSALGVWLRCRRALGSLLHTASPPLRRLLLCSDDPEYLKGLLASMGVTDYDDGVIAALQAVAAAEAEAVVATASRLAAVRSRRRQSQRGGSVAAAMQPPLPSSHW